MGLSDYYLFSFVLWRFQMQFLTSVIRRSTKCSIYTSSWVIFDSQNCFLPKSRLYSPNVLARD